MDMEDPAAGQNELHRDPPVDVPQFEAATVKLRLLGQQPFWPGVPELEAALASV